MVPERTRSSLRLTTGLVAVVGVLALAGGWSASRAAEAPLRGLPAPKHLSAQRQAEVKARMGRHGNAMSNLVRAVVLLDRPTVRTLAGRIGDEEIIAAHVGAKLALPDEYFTEQSALRGAAQQLAVAAAEGSSDATLADRFSAVTRTCVTCHSLYLRGRP
jgi:hypothetical protein